MNRRVVAMCLLALASSAFTTGRGRARAGKAALDAQIVSSSLSMLNNVSIENVPDGVDPAVVRDEVRITELSVERVCLDVILRTWDRIDRAPSDWTYELNGVDVWPSDASIAHTTKSYPAPRQSDVLEFIAALSPFQVRDLENGEFRVNERSFPLCGTPATTRGRVELKVRMRGDPSTGPLGMNYRWDVTWI